MSRRPDASPRSARLAERLAIGHRQRFCGREAELALFRSALAGEGAAFSVLYVHGLGGVGKSALLREYAAFARERGTTPVCLDGRMIDPSPAGFLLALRDALGLSASESPIDRLLAFDRLVLILDGCELLAPIDGWLRDTLLPQLAARALIVIAGRTPPSPDWTADLGWGSLVHVLPLRNLSDDESRTLLTLRQVPGAQQPAVLAFTHGHPLALVLVADVMAAAGPEAPFSPDRAPNVVRTLVERMAAHAPSPQHRRALELCAHVRVTSEPLLAAAIDGGDAHGLFEWLRGLSFMEQGPEGLFPHDVAREALDADFRWRDPDGYREMHARVWRYLRERLRTSSGRAQQRAFFDKLFLHRFNPIGARYHEYGTLGSIFAEPPAAEDHAAILDAVRRYEGEDSARIAAHWLRRQPQAFQIIRGVDGGLLGLAAGLWLHECGPEDAAADPAVAAALQHARQHGPVRAGEESLHHRFHVACDGYQQISPTINLLATMVSVAPARRPRLAWSFVTFSEADPWRPIMSYIGFQHAPGAAFAVGGHEYAVFAHDWRVEPFDVWWEKEIDRSLAPEPDREAADVPAAAPLLVLAEADFAAAVRQALRDYAHPQALAASPLLRSRVLQDAAGPSPAAANLQALLREAVARLEASERDVKFHRALWHTFIEPAPSQERCAERLGLPFSTYRYQLARGTDLVIARLWQRELHGGT